MQSQTNRRGNLVHFVKYRHTRLDDLKQIAKDFGLQSKYLYLRNLPESPHPEFHTVRLKHETTPDGLRGIRKDQGFRDPSEDSLVWWSLAMGPEEIQSAETRFLEETFPDRTEEQASEQQSFLWRFTTSPAFKNTSRLGWYRFTFPLEEVLGAYSTQFCGGVQPIMRIYKTDLYKQEVMHVVLVHSPADQDDFSEYPLLTDDDPNAICVFRDGRFIWRPEAMSETHNLELIYTQGRNVMEVKDVPSARFYVWDHAAVAFHVKRGQTLKFDIDGLRQNLKYCNPDKVQYTLSNETHHTFDEAKQLVKSLWPDFGRRLEVERSLLQGFRVSAIKLILVGWIGSGKSSIGNLILGRHAFGTASPAASPPTGTPHCCLQRGKVFDWMVDVIDTPGLSKTVSPTLRSELFGCINSSAPAPHTLLLVIKLGPSFAEVQDTLSQVEKMFGENIWRKTVVIFTTEDQTELDIEEQLKEAKRQLRSVLLKNVNNRYQVLKINPDHYDDGQQVWDLLYAAERTVLNQGK
ncbi:T-cell immunoglobulin and mucin domain-containing protein 4 isoform X2 [Cololabis saira]|uniref:T-cell immunoglobulin and mucin domain-containing protein 4 isoform X2 n=1 Tax=Cololabis saira TaxID=129043 RepID=UPI002AD4ACC0|nr:T-cell immunoglobulin and mucin domain-containing protein 4 isoform X2 [Cololabis saira]